RRLVRDHLEDEPLDARRLPPIALERLKRQLDAGSERDKLVGPSADRRLFEPVVADLLDVFFWNDPAGPGCGAVEHYKIGPRLLQLEADAPRIWRFHRGNAFLQ